MLDLQPGSWRAALSLLPLCPTEAARRLLPPSLPSESPSGGRQLPVSWNHPSERTSGNLTLLFGTEAKAWSSLDRSSPSPAALWHHTCKSATFVKLNASSDVESSALKMDRTCLDERLLPHLFSLTGRILAGDPCISLQANST